MHIFFNHRMKWLGICLLIFIPLITLYALKQQVEPLNNAFISSSSDFQYKKNDGEWRDYDPALYEEEKVTGSYWFKTILPENHWRDPHMYLLFVPNAEVYIENELIYTFSPHFQYWEHPHLIPLPDDFSGQTLMIRVDFNGQIMYPGKIIIDSPLNIIINTVLQSDYRLLLGIVSLLVGIAGYIIYVGKKQSSYLYFSLFALYIAQLCASRSWHLLGLLTPLPTFAYFQNVLLPIGGYFFLQFYEHLFGNSPFRINRWLSYVMIVMFGLQLIASLFFPSFYLNEMSILLQNVFAPVVVVFILFLTIHTYRKRRDTESFWLMAGILTFGLLVLLYFLFPFIFWIADRIAPEGIRVIYRMMFEGDRFLHGVFILLFCMAMVLRARIQSIYHKAQKSAEELKRFNDSLEQLVQERTIALEQTNENLRTSMQKTAEVMAEVAVLEERNRIAQDMHDRTGHALTGALIQLEAARMLGNKDTNMMLEKLDSARESVAIGLDSIRETVRMMKLDYEEKSLDLSIQKLIKETEAAVSVRISYDPQPLPDLDSISKKTLYLALQEGLTNGIRHGKATHFQFSLKADKNYIYFQLINNGKSYVEQEFGFGLNTMRERIENLNGTLHIESTDVHACVLRITLPIETKDDEMEEVP